MSVEKTHQTSIQPSPFLEQLIRFLVPFFLGSATDFDAARLDVLETLASYGARSRAQMLKAAQIIAFGMSALETLAEVDPTEMSPNMRLRYRACGNSLNRSGLQQEKSLTASLRCDQPATAKPSPRPDAEPVNDVPEAEAQRSIEQAQARIDGCRNRLSGAGAATKTPTIATSKLDRNKQLWGGAMMDTLAQMGMPVVPVDPSTTTSDRAHK